MLQVETLYGNERGFFVNFDFLFDHLNWNCKQFYDTTLDL